MMHMQVAIIAEYESEAIQDLMAALSAEGIKAGIVRPGNITLKVAGGKHSITGLPLDRLEAVFLFLEPDYLFFVEPILTELSSMGVYCQVKPTAFNLLANIPYQYASLSVAGVGARRVRIVSSKHALEHAIKALKRPLIIEVYRNLERIQRLILDEKMKLAPFLRGFPERFDLIALFEQEEGDLIENVVIGKEVFSAKRKWIPDALVHSRRRVANRLSEQECKQARKAAQALGCDVALVKTINGKVVLVEPVIDFSVFRKVVKTDLCREIALLYKDKVGS